MADAVYYRYEDVKYAAPVDEWDMPCGEGQLVVVLREFPVLKRTPKGAWVNGWHGRRFVRDEAHKRYACATKEDAKRSFIARKVRQASIYRARLRRAERVLRMMQGEMELA